jgi:hypothetical protein
MPERAPHHETFDRRVWCEGDVHGSKDRAKDASPGACDDHSCVRRVHALRAHARPRSPPRRPPDIRCRRRAIARGRNPRERTDQPRSSFRRRPAKSDAFPTTRMPFTVATRENDEGDDPSCLAPALPLTPPALTRVRRMRVCGWALQGHGAVTRGFRELWEYERLFYPMEFRAWN